MAAPTHFPSTHTIEEGIKIFGNASKLAVYLGISRQAVSKWKAKGHTHIPVEYEIAMNYAKAKQ